MKQIIFIIFIFPIICFGQQSLISVDGNSNEWDNLTKKNVHDSTTHLKYNSLNDEKNLYCLLIIPKGILQQKAMNMGMNLYVDIKGKKRERTFIEFPIKMSEEEANFFALMPKPEGIDPKEYQKIVRQIRADKLITCNVNGFENLENGNQALQIENNIKIAFSFDEKDEMILEYAIPLNLLGNTNDLKNKEISIGWKLKALEMPSMQNNNPQSFSQRGNNSFSSSNRRVLQNFNPNSQELSNSIAKNKELMLNEVDCWFKHIIN